MFGISGTWSGFESVDGYISDKPDGIKCKFTGYIG